MASTVRYECKRCGKVEEAASDAEEVRYFTSQFWQPYGLLDVCDICWRVLRQAAWNAYGKARRYNLIYPPHNCERCGRTDRPLAGHHVDYRHPLDVRWMCVMSCHAKQHREDRKAWRSGKALELEETVEVDHSGSAVVG